MKNRITRFAKKIVRKVFLFKVSTLDPFLRIDAHFTKKVSSAIPIDVIIPVSGRHVPMLPYVVKSVRTFIRHPVKNILIVAKDTDRVRDACKELMVGFVDEFGVLGYDKGRIDYHCSKGQNRAGWLYQQLLKLSADRISNEKKILILDASTVFVRPKIFCHNGRDIYDYSDQWHAPYFAMYERMLHRKPVANASLVCNYMLFDRDKLLEMKKEVEQLHHKPFDEVILDQLDRKECSGFSEYETYGNYVMDRWPKECKGEYSFNRRCDPAQVSTLKSYAKSISWL